MLTIPYEGFTPYLPPGTGWIRGQLEKGDSTEYLHWQIIVAFQAKQSILGVRACFGSYHAELTKSDKADDYVWKEDTRVAGTQFEFGVKPINRNSKHDWESIWRSAQSGVIETIPAQVRVVSYRTIRAIAADYACPTRMERTTYVYWGSTGSGKSHKAWELAGPSAYSKDPRSKFWCGYQGQEVVVIDEFRGGIDVAHVLRWLDKYPVYVETKGSSTPLKAKTIYFTSNLNPIFWYPDLDERTVEALFRRIIVEEMNTPFLA
jgi:hypothetical protein